MGIENPFSSPSMTFFRKEYQKNQYRILTSDDSPTVKDAKDNSRYLKLSWGFRFLMISF